MRVPESGRSEGGREDGVLVYVGWPVKAPVRVSRSECYGWINGPEQSSEAGGQQVCTAGTAVQLQRGRESKLRQGEGVMQDLLSHRKVLRFSSSKKRAM